MVIPERVQQRYLDSLHAEGECLVSSYSVGSHGYAQVGWHQDGRRVMHLGHRIAWFIAHGELPANGLTVDHLCRNRRCGRIDHLRLLSNVENARLNGNAVKTHCKRGHAFSDENAYRDGKGHRRCRACAKQRAAPVPDLA